MTTLLGFKSFDNAATAGVELLRRTIVESILALLLAGHNICTRACPRVSECGYRMKTAVRQRKIGSNCGRCGQHTELCVVKSPSTYA